MLPKIDPVNYERCYPRRLKKIFQSNLNMCTYGKFVPEMERAVVGNLPPELIHFFSKGVREKGIKDFQNVLADVTKYLRATSKKFSDDIYFNPITCRKSQIVLDWEKDATNLLNACLKRFSDNQLTGELEFIKSGVAGKVFRLSIMDKDGNKIMRDKALKVFHHISFGIPEGKRVHGNFAESNFWTFLKFWVGHKLDNTKYTRHYISDLENGYALTEFAQAGIQKTTSDFDVRKILRIRRGDRENNMPIFGKLYDGGGFVKCKDFIDDKVTLKYFKKLMNRSPKELPEVLARYEALAKNPKTPHRDKIQKAIDLFKNAK